LARNAIPDGPRVDAVELRLGPTGRNWCYWSSPAPLIEAVRIHVEIEILIKRRAVRVH
jgi:hypothetical protein